MFFCLNYKKRGETKPTEKVYEELKEIGEMKSMLFIQISKMLIYYVELLSSLALLQLYTSSRCILRPGLKGFVKHPTFAHWKDLMIYHPDLCFNVTQKIVAESQL